MPPRPAALRFRRIFLLGLLAFALAGCSLLVRGELKKYHPAFADAPEVARTADGAPGDALNVALVGTEEQLLRRMRAAGWFTADAVTLGSSVRIGVDTVFRRAYNDAPVSSLFVWGRRQDFAFERPVGHDPRQRHHVRFWRSDQADADGRWLWLGAATYDTGVGLSHRTGHVTHHISPEIDAERDKLVGDLRDTGQLDALDWVDNFQPDASGLNGGGDPWRTDQRLAIGVLRPETAVAEAAPKTSKQ